MKVAIFDFDGTIYQHETFTLLMDYLKEHPEYRDSYKPFYQSIVLPYFAYKFRIYPELKMKANLMQKYLNIFKGESLVEIEQFFSGLVPNMVGDFHPLVMERLERHQQNGDYIMVVSGAFLPLLKQVLKEMPINKIIGTEIPSHDNLFDHTKAIDHIQAERKTVAIQEALASHSVDWENSFAYGDSLADYPVLKMVGNPVAVCPEPRLLEIANKRQWEKIC